MIDFSAWIDLPLIWGVVIAIAVFLYVFLDGFDLGCGIIFPFAPSRNCRNLITSSIAPFWDGNETWLVLAGGGLFAAFPLAYSVILPALYLPITFMLLGLIFRGVAFEFRLKGTASHTKFWDVAFRIGSIVAAFMQGIILGNFIQGIEVEGRAFAGGSLDWANGFSIFTGVALVFGYALLGATWLIMKTDGVTQKWARSVARYVLAYVGFFMVMVSIAMPFVDEQVIKVWFTLPNFFYLMPIPLLTAFAFLLLWRDLRTPKTGKTFHDARPFFTSVFLFFLAYIGLAVSIYPWIVPFKFTIWQAASAPTSQSLLLIGVAVLLPVILAYTGYSYYIFRGKSSKHEDY